MISFDSYVEDKFFNYRAVAVIWVDEEKSRLDSEWTSKEDAEEQSKEFLTYFESINSRGTEYALKTFKEIVREFKIGGE